MRNQHNDCFQKNDKHEGNQNADAEYRARDRTGNEVQNCSVQQTLNPVLMDPSEGRQRIVNTRLSSAIESNRLSAGFSSAFFRAAISA